METKCLNNDEARPVTSDTIKLPYQTTENGLYGLMAMSLVPRFYKTWSSVQVLYLFCKDNSKQFIIIFWSLCRRVVSTGLKLIRGHVFEEWMYNLV